MRFEEIKMDEAMELFREIYRTGPILNTVTYITLIQGNVSIRENFLLHVNFSGRCLHLDKFQI